MFSYLVNFKSIVTGRSISWLDRTWFSRLPGHFPSLPRTELNTLILANHRYVSEQISGHVEILLSNMLVQQTKLSGLSKILAIYFPSLNPLTDRISHITISKFFLIPIQYHFMPCIFTRIENCNLTTFSPVCMKRQISLISYATPVCVQYIMHSIEFFNVPTVEI